jgi:hypothetical protein
VSMSEGYGPRLAKAVGAVCEGFAGLLLEVQGLQRLKVSMSEGYGPGFAKMYKCCLCFVHCAAVQSISLTVLTTYHNVFKNRFSQQLSRAAATTMDSSGQTSRDIGGHVS